MKASGLTRSVVARCNPKNGERSLKGMLGVPSQLRQYLPSAVQKRIPRLEESELVTTIDSFLCDVTMVGERVVGDRWNALPEQQRLLIGLSVAFVISNMDKVNMSLAIIPMAREFGWGPSVAGLVQSSFFYGYLLSQIPGGILCSKYGGRAVIPKGVGLWSAATLGLPFLAGTIPGICAARAAVGLGEAVAPSAATDIVGRAVPKEERSRAIAFVFGGLNVGSIAGLLIVPFLIDHFGWASVFTTFGCLGTVWVLWFGDILNNIQESDPELYQSMNARSSLEASSEDTDSEAEGDSIPWRAIVRSTPVQALAVAHFSTNWFGYTMMAWLPSYITSTLKMDIAGAAQVSLFPPVVAYFCAILSGQVADGLISSGWETAKVRKLIQAIACLGPAAFLVGGVASHDPTTEVGCVALAIGLASFCMGGLFSNHQDLSTKYSSFLLGLTNTSAAIPGILGVWLTGFLYEKTGDWHMALFAPAVVTMCVGTIIYTKYGGAEPELFEDDQPFAVEQWLKSILP
ncbi:hypothetical protein BSKO_07829 [Bryopsis sp. KO-2023]|nr:hypothetical protein BSKO_07829 [Bryopsis sp. KO-2023]